MVIYIYIIINIGSINYKTVFLRKDELNLREYLNQHKHYIRFEKHLNKTLSLENLLFYVKVSIMKNLYIMKLNDSDNIVYPDNARNDELNFNYLMNLYKQYKDVPIRDISLSIYETFITNDSPHCVNVSYDARQNVIKFFNDSNIDAFDDLKFVYIFDKCLHEIWCVLNSIFRFQFNTYQ